MQGRVLAASGQANSPGLLERGEKRGLVPNQNCVNECLHIYHDNLGRVPKRCDYIDNLEE
jgi:hypothetical protein